MTSQREPTTDPTTSVECEIRLQGQLDPRWGSRFDGLRLTHDGDGTTTLRGPVADQAALFGVLRKVRDIGLPLISVIYAGSVQPDPTSPFPTTTTVRNGDRSTS